MTISIWRYSHLSLAISAALFIVIASLTGIILAFEPISKKLKSHSVANNNAISIAETIYVLQKKYKEVFTIEVDENNFVIASVITKGGDNKIFYINPKTGEKVGDLIQKAPIFEFATNLHRSLFLKSTGRFLIGFASFLLFLITITGVILISKRQGGIHKIFSKIVRENFNQYYHVVLGRWFLIPILIITVTGFYLSLNQFSLLQKETNSLQNFEVNKTAENLKFSEFEFFKTTKLAEIKKIEFPFSSDEEDSFFIKTINNEFEIHQFKGQVISQKSNSIVALGSYYSLLLHTGRGSVLWSAILLLACLAILFFIFSGFLMTLKRNKKTSTMNNKAEKDKAEFILLVGSETGSTMRFAIAFQKALLRANKTVFIAVLNSYSTYRNAKNIIIFTATYGEGEAPANGHKFMKRMHAIQPTNNINYAVVGFGSKAYPDFCKFAILLHASLQVHEKFTPIVPLFKVDNQNINSFNNWAKEWSTINQLSLKIDAPDFLQSTQKHLQFKVVEKTELNTDATFLISLKPNKNTSFTSGDLLSITQKDEDRKRLYSIAKVDNKIVLSIKKHKFGSCSNYLNQLNKNDFITGVVQKNKNFHFPNKSKEVILIANGTGVAPFLGMINNEKIKSDIHLFLGVRTKESLEIYSEYLYKIGQEHLVKNVFVSYSKENKASYVQDTLLEQQLLVVEVLKNKGSILICGSLMMQKDVEKIIDKIATKHLKLNVAELKENNQIKTACY
jgi:sulfite reductase (NADPH) flavoprotein alpha-component